MLNYYLSTELGERCSLFNTPAMTSRVDLISRSKLFFTETVEVTSANEKLCFTKL